MTNSDGIVTELLSYYPFGALQYDTGVHSEQRKYTGHEYDASDYTYAGARYLNTKVGRFLSEDPAFLAVGSSGQKDLEAYLSDPQGMNSYSYVKNNPLKFVDPNGQQAMPVNLSSLSFSFLLGGAALSTAPAWVTGAILIAAGAVIVVGTGALLRNNDGLRQMPFEKTREVQIPKSGEPPKIDPKTPKWAKWVYIGVSTAAAIYEEIQRFIDQKNAVQDLIDKSKNNAGVKTYITPSGAVVDENGRLISGPTH